MKVLFCKISYMKYYKGVHNNDPAFNGGKFVDENGYGHEEYNFKPITFNESLSTNFPAGEYCLGFVETKSQNGEKRNQLRIENIYGCKSFKSESVVDDVLVIWCATREQNDIRIVGWYKHASVYRDYQTDMSEAVIESQGSEGWYNIIAESKNCVLLPHKSRNWHGWSVPSSKKKGYGFGQSLVWYATEPAAEQYVANLVKNIEGYMEGNHLYISND